MDYKKDLLEYILQNDYFKEEAMSLKGTKEEIEWRRHTLRKINFLRNSIIEERKLNSQVLVRNIEYVVETLNNSSLFTSIYDDIKDDFKGQCESDALSNKWWKIFNIELKDFLKMMVVNYKNHHIEVVGLSNDNQDLEFYHWKVKIRLIIQNKEYLIYNDKLCFDENFLNKENNLKGWKVKSKDEVIARILYDLNFHMNIKGMFGGDFIASFEQNCIMEIAFVHNVNISFGLDFTHSPQLVNNEIEWRKGKLSIWYNNKHYKFKCDDLEEDGGIWYLDKIRKKSTTKKGKKDGN